MKKIILPMLVPVALLLSELTTPASASTIFTLSQSGCSGSNGCGSGPFGTVTLDQITSPNTPASVAVTVTLTAGEFFVGTGAGTALAFNVASTPTISNISSGFSLGSTNVKASAFGSFVESVTCSTCQGGNLTNPTGPLKLTVSSANGVLISDFVANNKGYFFASDILAVNGNSGNVASKNADPASPPEPASLALIGLGLSGLFLFRKHTRK